MIQPVERLARAALAAPLLLLLGAASARQVGQDQPIYDPAADARAAVSRATEVATKKHKRVLVVFGHDASEGHAELYTVLKSGKTDRWPFYYEYELVAVDAGADGAKNAELAEALGAGPGSAAPRLTVLDAAGKPLANRVASEFRGDAGWDEAKLGRFLAPHAVEPLDAEDVLKSALARAAAQDARVFVHLGAPW